MNANINSTVLNYLSGLKGNVQTTIDGLMSDISDLGRQAGVILLGVRWSVERSVPAGLSVSLPATSFLSELNIPETEWGISPHSLDITEYAYDVMNQCWFPAAEPTVNTWTVAYDALNVPHVRHVNLPSGGGTGQPRYYCISFSLSPRAVL